MIRAVKAGELFSTFVFNGKDCADMGVYSVTSGSVYTLNLEPVFSDNKVEVPAYDGKYYYGTQITGQQFQFNCFCHDLITQEYDRLRAWLNPRRIGRLVLSDQPYKYYLCKVVNISPLSAYPLTTVQTPQNSFLGDFAEGDVVYTGNFTVTFETVGSAYGYGLSYYRDDLIYDAKTIYGVDYYYNSGLLYRDMSPKCKWRIDNDTGSDEPGGVNRMPIPMYNPGSAATSPKYLLEHEGTFEENSFIRFDNATTGSSTVIDLSGCTGDIIIDTIEQVLQDENGDIFYGRFSGTVMSIDSYRDVIEIPETFVRDMENTDMIEYDSLYIEDNVVSINPLVLQVNDDMVGKFFCCNHNGGSKIQSVDITENTLQLDNTVYTADVPGPEIEDGEVVRPAGFKFHYIEINDGDLPESANEGDVCVQNGTWYLWVIYDTQGNGEWQQTNYFDNKDEFKDNRGNFVDVYKMFGATIVDLDDLRITTGKNVSYNMNGKTIQGASMTGVFVLSAELQPRYL